MSDWLKDIFEKDISYEKKVEEVKKHEEIEVVYLVTDYEDSFISMSQVLSDKTTYQLYRDYLDNFRINAGRNAR